MVGENRKLLIFPLDEVPEMARGQGVYLQRYKDGGLLDATTFTWKDGLKDENNRAVRARRTEGVAGRARPGRTHRAARLGQFEKVRPELNRGSGVTGDQPENQDNGQRNTNRP